MFGDSGRGADRNSPDGTGSRPQWLSQLSVFVFTLFFFGASEHSALALSATAQCSSCSSAGLWSPTAGNCSCFLNPNNPNNPSCCQTFCPNGCNGKGRLLPDGSCEDCIGQSMRGTCCGSATSLQSPKIQLAAWGHPWPGSNASWSDAAVLGSVCESCDLPLVLLIRRQTNNWAQLVLQSPFVYSQHGPRDSFFSFPPFALPRNQYAKLAVHDPLRQAYVSFWRPDGHGGAELALLTFDLHARVRLADTVLATAGSSALDSSEAGTEALLVPQTADKLDGTGSSTAANARLYLVFTRGHPLAASASASASVPSSFWAATGERPKLVEVAELVPRASPAVPSVAATWTLPEEVTFDDYGPRVNTAKALAAEDGSAVVAFCSLALVRNDSDSDPASPAYDLAFVKLDLLNRRLLASLRVELPYGATPATKLMPGGEMLYSPRGPAFAPGASEPGSTAPASRRPSHSLGDMAGGVYLYQMVRGFSSFAPNSLGAVLFRLFSPSLASDRLEVRGRLEANMRLTTGTLSTVVSFQDIWAGRLYFAFGADLWTVTMADFTEDLPSARQTQQLLPAMQSWALLPMPPRALGYLPPRFNALLLHGAMYKTESSYDGNGMPPSGTPLYDSQAFLLKGCAPGTLYQSDTMSCAYAPPGRFAPGLMRTDHGSSVVADSTLCPAGTHNPWWGAYSLEACRPCPTGRFSNVSGASACFACAEDDYCPFAMSSPLPLGMSPHASSLTRVSFPETKVDEDRELERRVLLLCDAVAASILLLALLAVLGRWLAGPPAPGSAFDSCGRGCRTVVCHFDMFSSRHPVPNGSPVIKQKRVLGGLVSLCFLTVAAGVMYGVYREFSVHNVQQRSYYGPLLQTQRQAQQVGADDSSTVAPAPFSPQGRAVDAAAGSDSAGSLRAVTDLGSFYTAFYFEARMWGPGVCQQAWPMRADWWRAAGLRTHEAEDGRKLYEVPCKQVLDLNTKKFAFGFMHQPNNPFPLPRCYSSQDALFCKVLWACASCRLYLPTAGLQWRLRTYVPFVNAVQWLINTTSPVPGGSGEQQNNTLETRIVPDLVYSFEQGQGAVAFAGNVETTVQFEPSLFLDSTSGGHTRQRLGYGLSLDEMRAQRALSTDSWLSHPAVGSDSRSLIEPVERGLSLTLHIKVASRSYITSRDVKFGTSAFLGNFFGAAAGVFAAAGGLLLLTEVSMRRAAKCRSWLCGEREPREQPAARSPALPQEEGEPAGPARAGEGREQDGRGEEGRGRRNVDDGYQPLLAEMPNPALELSLNGGSEWR